MACAEDEVWWVRYRAGQTLMSLAEGDVAHLKSFIAGVSKAAPALTAALVSGPAPALKLAGGLEP